jgi:hypothetical protein
MSGQCVILWWHEFEFSRSTGLGNFDEIPYKSIPFSLYKQIEKVRPRQRLVIIGVGVLFSTFNKSVLCLAVCAKWAMDMGSSQRERGDAWRGYRKS